MKRVDFLILAFILIIAFFFRLYKINTPLADLHSWRQADTAAVARNFVTQGFDLLHPRYDDMSNVQSGLDNPQGYRMVEFPLYNAIFAWLFKLFPAIPLTQWGRLTSIFFSLITISVIYYLLAKEQNRSTAFWASAIYAIFPFFVFFSRVILPESTALGFTMLSIFFLYLFSKKQYSNITIYLFYLLSLISFAAALLIKPTVIFCMIPIAYLFFQSYKWKFLKKPSFYLYFLIALTPLILWRNYIGRFPEGIPVNEWLLTSVNTGGSLQKIFFRPAFFRWIFFERINNLILGGYLTVFFILGIIAKRKNFFLYSYLLSSISYLLVFQGGNVQHEYYQTLILPFLAIFSALGINFLFEKKSNIYHLASIILVFVLLLFSWYFSYYKVKDYYQYSQELIQEAKILNDLTSKEDKIVTDRMGDTTLLYLAERRGAPSIYKEPEDLKKLGYSFLVTSSQYQIEKMEKNFEIIFENDKFTLFSL
ncbi:MAG: 4-amino-4-deoxy-L-arabinose transferase and related glycosyltransferases of PMT family [Candidatus Roizmanbacteria bacterium GW2011_GWC2_37_13]|uniref:4-amino-4-deoxy-L-arabinose transferase and related glycosyltransferases of PMT family n=1 Tax=Candidatus Roizmanbacteria bacterium GW2011_GWC2_37_13 TaxID=1618486 RepID=A0A0G0JED8_9BACT|nr:MAG: 4-amino-4-deoxy-L-arabinose transferase and related glycosyltransferases of PMT family [Candidatus Roizmanbacteria bacterium GW2011_GWC1_37_12]KKQ26536.1 MAG: 4-amino-4-deoxy-L-arabinose transferase and related glycosyltransferases of PMT family [Candidatus Roizmanbacteria bacterium GW2011_GWC2_37_13]